ncbi:hypothetical protein G9A89_013132 [Geosiphon pyriformis]|nr:hypothetical protein G9A89_013132 [Geosiphon pyriformis]
MALLGSLFQLLPGCIGLKSVLQDAVKLFCVEFASQESLNIATKVAISNKIFLIILKIVQFSSVASVFSPFLSIALHDIPLGTSSDDIKTALGIFGVVTTVKLKSAGLWQYTVVNFKNISSAAAALSNWSVLAAAFVVLSGAAAADMDLDLGGPPKTVTSMLSAVFFVPNSAVESRLASLESYLSELFMLIKSLVEPVGALVVLVTKLLFTSSAVNVLVKECVDGLAKQNKGLAAVTTVMQKRLTCLETICE